MRELLLLTPQYSSHWLMNNCMFFLVVVAVLGLVGVPNPLQGVLLLVGLLPDIPHLCQGLLLWGIHLHQGTLLLGIPLRVYHLEVVGLVVALVILLVLHWVGRPCWVP